MAIAKSMAIYAKSVKSVIGIVWRGRRVLKVALSDRIDVTQERIALS